MHRFIPDPAAPSPKTAFLDAARPAAVKKIVRELLSLPPDTVVTITERPCADPGCPILETLVAVFPDHGPARSRAEPTRVMLAQALATPPEAAGAANLDAAVKLAP